MRRATRRFDVSSTPHAMVAGAVAHRAAKVIWSAVTAGTILIANTLLAPPAVADAADGLRSAITSVHSASCGPLQSDPVAEEVALLTNREEDSWLNQEGRAVPTDDPLPLLKDRGYGGEKAKLLKGAGVTDILSIKGLLISGYLDLPDCTYRLYGVNVMQDRTTNYILTSVVLAA